ncbi:MAG: hypothetical protein AAF518_14350 [Spirochaetota bacterium]
MENTLNFIVEQRKLVAEKQLYKVVLPELVRSGFLQVLADNDFVSFHKKIAALSEIPSGLGLAVGLMAQVNVAGGLLQRAALQGKDRAAILLKEIQQGQSVISLGVSEKGWKGRLANITSRLEKKAGGGFYVHADKSFLTNGMHANYFILICRYEDVFASLLVTRETLGVQQQEVVTRFGKEATHCRVICDAAELAEEDVFFLDYEDFALSLRLSEMLSFAASFCGFGRYLLGQLSQQEHKQLKKDRLGQRHVLDLYTLLDLLAARVQELSLLKQQQPGLSLKPNYPFGLEAVRDIFLQRLFAMFSEATVRGISDDLLLFELKDPLNEILIRQAAMKKL